MLQLARDLAGSGRDASVGKSGAQRSENPSGLKGLDSAAAGGNSQFLKAWLVT